MNTIAAPTASRNLFALDARVGALMDPKVKHAVVMTAYDLNNVEVVEDSFDAGQIAAHAYDYMVDAGMSSDEALAASAAVGKGAFVR